MSEATTTTDPAATTAADPAAAGVTATGAAAALVDPAVVAATAATTTTPVTPPALTLPGKDADAGAWKAYYKAIGAPETGDSYELPMPEGADPEFAKAAAAKMADLGFLPHQAKGIAAWLNEQTAAKQAAAAKIASDAATAQESKVTAEDAALKNEWGERYTGNIETAKRAVRQFMPADAKVAAGAIEALEKALGYAETMKMLHKIGAGLAEGTLRGDGHQGNGTSLTGMELHAARLYPSTPAP